MTPKEEFKKALLKYMKAENIGFISLDASLSASKDNLLMVSYDDIEEDNYDDEFDNFLDEFGFSKS